MAPEEEEEVKQIVNDEETNEILEGGKDSARPARTREKSPREVQIVNDDDANEILESLSEGGHTQRLVEELTKEVVKDEEIKTAKEAVDGMLQEVTQGELGNDPAESPKAADEVKPLVRFEDPVTPDGPEHKSVLKSDSDEKAAPKAAIDISDEKPEPSQKGKVEEDDEEAEDGAAKSGACAELNARDLACGCMSPEFPLRVVCIRIVSSSYFENFIMLAILLNSVALAWERPAIKDGSGERKALEVIGHIFNGIFSVEFILKHIAFGVFFGPNAYWKDGWNKLDGFIVVVGWIDVLFVLIGADGGGLMKMLKICRMMRALRPLRAVNKLPALKQVVETLLLAIQPIGTTMIIVAIFFFIFGVFGVQLMSGKLYHCQASDTLSDDRIAEEVFTRTDCITKGGNWINQDYNFDNLPCAIMTLYVLASIDGWVDIMYSGVDAVGVDKQPQRDHNEGMILFFVAFLLVGGFFILNMFVGVIVESFQNTTSPAEAARQAAEKEQAEADAAVAAAEQEVAEAEEALTNLTAAKDAFEAAKAAGDAVAEAKAEAELQVALAEYEREMAEANEAREQAAREQAEAAQAKEAAEQFKVAKTVEIRFWEDYAPWRRAVYDMVMGTKFEAVIAFWITLNVLLMASEHYDMHPVYKEFLKICDIIFTAVFTIESLLKMVAFGPRHFFCGTQMGWNNFDLFIVTVSYVDMYFEASNTDLPINPALIRILRVARVLRILKLLKNAKDLVLLLATVTRSLRQVGNLALLLFLLFFIYAALGIELFGRMACTDTNPCSGLSEFANFEDFFAAMLILFRVSTGDNWNGIMKDGLRTEPENMGSPACSFAVDCTGNCCKGCDPDDECKENCCASLVLTPVYFMSFVLLAQFVMLNLVVAVLMQELEQSEEETEEPGDGSPKSTAVDEGPEDAYKVEGAKEEAAEAAMEDEVQPGVEPEAHPQAGSPGLSSPHLLEDPDSEPCESPQGEDVVEHTTESSPVEAMPPTPEPGAPRQTGQTTPGALKQPAQHPGDTAQVTVVDLPPI